jgi:hypothetical protein
MWDDRPIVASEVRFCDESGSSPRQTDEKCNQETHAPQQRRVGPAASLDSQPPSLISVLADGHAATAVYHRCDHVAGGDHGLARRFFYEVALAGMERSQQFRGSSDEPSPIVNIEFHQPFAAHFQKEGLADFLIRNIGAFHDLVDFERLLAKHIQDILPIIQHDYSLQPRNPESVHS